MRRWLIILFTLITNTVFSQVMSRLTGDTTIPLKVLDSLRAQIYYQKENINQMYWTYELRHHVVKADTLKLRPDSVVVNHLTSAGKLMKQEVLRYDKQNCMYSSKDRYFNETGLIVYERFMRHLCGQATQQEQELYTGSIPTQIMRYVYDKHGRIVKYVYWGAHRTRRLTYTYDASGKQSEQWEKIEFMEFWD